MDTDNEATYGKAFEKFVKAVQDAGFSGRGYYKSTTAFTQFVATLEGGVVHLYDLKRLENMCRRKVFQNMGTLDFTLVPQHHDMLFCVSVWPKVTKVILSLGANE